MIVLGGSAVAAAQTVRGATGAIVSSAGDEHLRLPAETRLQFQLCAAVSIQP